jgi:hypothetical protein
MFGCLRRLGCLVFLLAAAAAGYYYYTHHWAPRKEETAAGVWRRVNPADADRGARSIAMLQSSSGKVFANLSATEAVGYLLQRVAQQLPPSSRDIEAMIRGDTLNVRAVIPIRDLGAGAVLGPLSSLLSERDTVQFGGTVSMVHNGLAQFHITRISIHGIALPAPAIPKLVRQLRHESPDGLAPNALALPLPSYISDIRIGNGKVTLYKNV